GCADHFRKRSEVENFARIDGRRIGSILGAAEWLERHERATLAHREDRAGKRAVAYPFFNRFERGPESGILIRRGIGESRRSRGRDRARGESEGQPHVRSSGSAQTAALAAACGSR